MGKPPSWNEIRTRAAAFAAAWSDETDEQREAQTFWNEFLAVFGVDRRRVATFEARAQRLSTGGRGRIDVWWPGTLIAEHKSAGRSLADAEAQALDYLDSVDPDAFPGVVITSDFGHVRVRDLAGDNVPFEFPLTDLVLHIDRFGFIAGYQRRAFSPQQEEAANVQAAQLMGRLYDELARSRYRGHESSILLMRLLFLMFGDDTGLWERGLFQEWIITRTAADGTDLGPLLGMLFQTLDTDVGDRSPNLDGMLARFPFVNGGLFRETVPPAAFDSKMRDELLTACEFDWGTITPAIFGSLFQTIKSREARRELGEHYTSERNILRLIGPLFLDDLRARFEDARDSTRRLERLQDELGTLRLMDPACGCGNFLVVAYRELRRLELDIMVRLRELTGDYALTIDATLGLRVGPSQFYGIEIEEWPARIAETAMFLTDHQANLELSRDFGVAPDRLPITETATIVNANALHLDWRTVLLPGDDVIVLGNPPFAGSRKQTAEQRRDQGAVWAGNRREGKLDFVTNWFRLAADYAAGKRTRVAFVATNSITQGEQPPVLWPHIYDRGMGIDFAHRTFAWSSEAPGQAAVHVVIIGFSARPKPTRRPLWEYPDIREDGLVVRVANINAYLADAPDVLIPSLQRPIANVPPMLFGSMPRDGGHLSKIDAVEADRIRNTDPTAARYLRRLVGAEELINGAERWCLWTADMPPGDAASSPELRRRLAAVRQFREESKAAATQAWADRPSVFVQRAQPATRYLAVPSVSSEGRAYTPVAFMPPDVIALNLIFTIAGADDLLFGVMSSRAFTVWNRSISGRLESRLRISQEITYNNFPWLVQTDTGAPAVTAAAGAVLAARDLYRGESLATLYGRDSMPGPLADAHRALDVAVLRAYGLRPAATDAQVLAELLRRHEALRLASS